MKKATINVDEEEWNKFKEMARKNNSDTNKEIRKFVKEYLKDKGNK